MANFLILSLLSGVAELGGVYLGITWGLPIHFIILLPLFYQVGNLLTNILPSKAFWGIAVAGIVFVLLVIYSWYPSLWIFAVQLALTSYCIQLVRSRNKRSCATWLKRSFRVAGFALSPLMCFKNGQVIILLSMILCIFSLIRETLSRDAKKVALPTRKNKTLEISLVMVFHQLHYFIYSYMIPIYVSQKTGNLVASALLFSLSWVIYLIPQTIAEKLHIIHYKTMFFCCHAFLGLCMAAMSISAYFDNISLVLLFWILTGLGGGSVFCIKHLYKKSAPANMDLSENIGHFLGPILAIAVCIGSGNSVFVFLPAVSCLFVMMTLLSALYIVWREQRYEK